MDEAKRDYILLWLKKGWRAEQAAAELFAFVCSLLPEEARPPDRPG